jgi:hypothetical protein
LSVKRGRRNAVKLKQGEPFMKIGTLFLINGILAIGHGLGFILLPSMLLAIYQVPSIAPGAVLLGQLFGVQLLFIAIVVWNARDLRDGRALGAIVLGGVVTSAVGTVVTAKALADGIFCPMGWLAVTIYALLALGYLDFQLQPAKRAA